MHFLRKGVVWLAISALPILLLGIASSFALSRSFGNPEPIKGVLKDSGIYTSALDGFLEVTNNPNVNSTEDISADNPVVNDAIKKAFPPELLQNSVEGFIDSLYAWLEGKTPTLDFRVDLTQAKTTFVNEVAAGAEAKARTLPACPRGQTGFDDPFAATCLPRGASPALAGEKIRQELTGEEAKFLKDPVITADSFKSKDNKPAFSTSSELPENYQRLSKIPFVLGFLALAALTVIILLSESRAKGVKRVGITLLVVGVSLALVSWLTNSLVNNLLAPKIKFENAILQEKVQKIVKNISGDAGQNFMIAGGTYAAVGVVAVTGAVLINRRRGEGSASSSENDNKSPNDKSPGKPTAKPKDTKTPPNAK